jgi:hypothetical protein
MYRIEKRDWGFHLTFSGVISDTEMAQWLEDSRRKLVGASAPFGVLVDMRSLVPLSRDAQVYMLEGQKYFRESGMERSVVVLSSPVIAAQFRRIGGETGIGRWERYIDSTAVENWEEVGMKWLLNEIDPDEGRSEIKTGPLSINS